ncbi:MAG TPA: potassium-transporting ATPase subunit KdpC [Casimicrobiaceae bacterium]|nr:potassium-transporting ATPase subunit KdpC [Casimicrobiaceae bacterium]
MARTFRDSLLMLIVMTLVTGVAYPLLVTGIAQLTMSRAANGSIVEHDGKAVGSALIGQPFSDPKYFWGRPSATSPMPYNSGASSGSNLGPLNPALADAVKSRVDALRAADPDNRAPVPVDLVTASGSGLDPHVSPAAAAYQTARVAKVRGIAVDRVSALVTQHTRARQLGFLGEPVVDVLQLNLALDTLQR